MFSLWILEFVVTLFLFPCQSLSFGMDQERSGFSFGSVGCISGWRQAGNQRFVPQGWKFGRLIFKNSCLILYTETFKRTPSIKWTPDWVPNFSSNIYFKINLHSADTSVKQAQTPIISHSVAQNLQLISREHFKGILLLKLSSDSFNLIQRCRFNVMQLYFKSVNKYMHDS